MKNPTKKPDTMPAADVVQAIGAIIKTAEKLKNAYFWTPGGNASDRARREACYNHPRIEWEEGGHVYTAAYSVSLSRANFYTYPDYTRDGKKTTLTAIRNSYNRLCKNG